MIASLSVRLFAKSKTVVYKGMFIYIHAPHILKGYFKL